MKFSPFSFAACLNGSFFDGTLRSQVVGSPADIAKLLIRLMARGYGFNEERMRVIIFLEFLALGIHIFALRLTLY